MSLYHQLQEWNITHATHFTLQKGKILDEYRDKHNACKKEFKIQMGGHIAQLLNQYDKSI